MTKHMTQFELLYAGYNAMLLNSETVEVGEWHSKKLPGLSSFHTMEVTHTSFEMQLPDSHEVLQFIVSPNLPWAEDHFLERVSGDPMNPAPSHEWWPFGNTATHQKDTKFSHTYPERFWPKYAGEKNFENMKAFPGHKGIRYEYGDLGDVIALLSNNPLTRQAYLPVWFPEDTGGGHRLDERVPCTLGYHFLVRSHTLDITYFMRSCDFVRHFRDDVYMAGRLAQFVCAYVNYHRRQKMLTDTGTDEGFDPIKMGKLRMHISSLHAMEGDRTKMKEYEDGEWEES